MKKIIVLGAGLVGGAMAADLAQDFDVTAVDINQSVLDSIKIKEPRVTPLMHDLSKPEAVKKLVKDFHMVINAVPGHMGFRTLKAIIEAGRDVVDIAFFPEDPFLLDDLAIEKNVTAIMDCGVSPGMSNVFIGHIDSLLDKTESIMIYVGGLPEIREWPYEYKAVFSPYDVIEEYVRPARYVENGAMVVRPALSDAELLNFPGIGTLEAFNSDGLRTLANTMDAPFMKEKTLRYPGHIEKMAMLRQSGFFSTEEIDFNGAKIRPLDFTARLLFPQWQMKEGDRDITVLQLIIEGEKDGTRLRYVYDLFDRFDENGNVHSMARTTGYTATVAARLLFEGLYKRKGVSPPEFIGRESDCVDYMIKGLKDRGVIYNESLRIIDSPCEGNIGTGLTLD